MEEQLQELNRKFRARIGQGTVALTQANGDLANGKFPNQVANAQMADMGELAASIAHDFNNILGIVQAYAALIVSHAAKLEDVIEHAASIADTRFDFADFGNSVCRSRTGHWPVHFMGSATGALRARRIAR